MARVFHTLPPPESLEDARNCDSKIAPTDGSPLEIIDEALLEYLGTGISPSDLGDGPEHKGASFRRASELDGWRALSSPLFDDLRRLDDTSGEQQALQSANLKEKFDHTVASGRLGVMLSEERSLVPARYHGWLVMYSMETTLPYCWQRVEVLGTSSLSIETRVQDAVNRTVKSIAPGAVIHWGTRHE